MTTPAVLVRPEDAPLGAHVLSFHAGPREAARHAADFLRGTPSGLAERYWVPDRESAEFYAAAAGDKAPDHVGCVALLPREQVELVDGTLRPVAEVREFLASHPEGVSAGADTISRYWGPETLDLHLEYEQWFDSQPRGRSRFLCPYDLRSIPPEEAPRAVRQLSAHHSHVILSDAGEPVVRLLQLFVFETAAELPRVLQPTLEWAMLEGWVLLEEETQALQLTPSGERLVHDWGVRRPADAGRRRGRGSKAPPGGGTSTGAPSPARD